MLIGVIGRTGRISQRMKMNELGRREIYISACGSMRNIDRGHFCIGHGKNI